ncbi:FGGY family carbohydrate kinase [Amycolatopsis carbonis]|uniref:FGGY family carbohydrate kinase n=1 Tax=Amycolatopsis carbonis TaxID=715471 RepID=A0A9Y2I9L1_9PSEU|nr:FGGY family carbohydrate kinase [Amycolatopsis sp. 2-15]WIX75211.1 FGGY family carbohydrate kinase [Amycolatopsis sp. 2-15]
MIPGLLLGIDIGTSSSKGVLVGADGTILARAGRAHTTSRPRPGWFEHDAETVWWADFTALVRELTAAAGDRPLAGLAVSGIGPVLLPADADGRPLRPAILYGVDTRAGAEIAELTAELGEKSIVERGGSALSSQAVGPKWRWLFRHEPEVAERAELFLMASSYLVLRLTGEYVLDHHSASQCDPMYDLRAGAWAEDWARLVAPGVRLPRLAWPTEVAGTVSASAAAATGLPAGLPVTCGTVDAWAEAASAGVRAPGDTMLMYGTTMFLVQTAAEPRPVPGLWATRGVFAGTYSLAAGMATSGAITDWLRDLVGGEFADLVAEAGEVPAGSRGLLMLPYFAGERTPVPDAGARGVLAGLTLSHTKADLYRAALEGTAYGVRHNLETMGSAEGRRLVAVGGGTQGRVWTQIVSDATRAEQHVPTETIGAAFGNALLAAFAVGLEPDIDAWNPVAIVVRPDPVRADVYDEFYARYRALYPATADIAHFLAAHQERAAAQTREK